MSVTAIPKQHADSPAGEEKPKKSKKKLIVILVAVLALGGGGWFFFLKPAPTGPPQPGDVVKLEAIQVNLASAHYLRIGLSLQLVAGVKEVDGSKALDAAIDVFSGKPLSMINDPVGRTRLKAQLEKRLSELYDHEVMGVYFTDFVTQ